MKNFSKKYPLLLAVLAFGVLHVLGSVLAGEITNMGAVITAALKTIQCGIFGVILMQKTTSILKCHLHL